MVRVHVPYKCDKPDVPMGPIFFTQESTCWETCSWSCQYLQKWGWTHMSPLPSSHTWWEALAASMALNWGLGKQTVTGLVRVTMLSVGVTPKGFEK